MANATTKNTTTSKPKDNTEDKKFEEMQKLINKQNEQIKKMMEMLSNGSVTDVVSSDREDSEELKEIEINPNKKVKITSLTFGLMTLYCQRFGFLRFENFGDTQIINYNQLSDYVTADRAWAEDGHYYINNKDMVEDLGLSFSYNKIFGMNLVNKIFDSIFDSNIEIDENVKNMIKNATTHQKQSLSAIICQKLYNNEFSDYNKIHILSDLLEIDIKAKVEEMKVTDQTFNVS